MDHPKPTPWVKMFLPLAMFAVATELADVHCNIPPSKPPSALEQVSDYANAITCTVGHWGEPFEQLALACWKDDSKAAADFIADVELLFAKRVAIAAPTIIDAGENTGKTLAALIPSPYVTHPLVLSAMDACRARELRITDANTEK